MKMYKGYEGKALLWAYYMEFSGQLQLWSIWQNWFIPWAILDNEMISRRTKDSNLYTKIVPFFLLLGYIKIVQCPFLEIQM
jgi:hypothetical protein